jgi:hypothetical protein
VASLRSKILIGTSLILLLATAYVVTAYGRNAYFVAFHKPLNLSLHQTSTKPYVAPTVPTFNVHASISNVALAQGGQQHITISETPGTSTSGYLEIWIESPANKQVYRSDTNGNPTQFTKGQPQTFTYSYMLPKNAPTGTYHVSAIITSSNNQTDYYVNPNFATFTVS